MATKPLLTKEQREDYVLHRLHEMQIARDRTVKSTGPSTRIMIDGLDADFVDGYIEATGTKFVAKMLGAHYSRDLGATMLSLYKQGLFERYRTGVQAPCGGGGWPTWVWSYYIPEGAMKSVRARLERNNAKTV